MPPALALQLAARHGIDLSAHIDAAGHYRWRDFAEFLGVYDAASAAIQTARDYYDLALAYYDAAAAEGAIYVEVMISPAHAARQGIAYPALTEALSEALEQARRARGIEGRLILTAVRHLGVEAVEEVARLALAHPHPMVTGFGMAGDETFAAPGDFARAFAIARDAGLGLTVHAGELAGPESVQAALAHLKPQRIGHGVRAIENSAVMDALRDSGAVLEVCPSSNVALRLYPSIAAHPVMRLAAAGLNITLGSDDPPFFFTSIGGEYEKVSAAHGLDDVVMLNFTRTAIEAAFCDEDTKARLRARIAEGEGAT